MDSETKKSGGFFRELLSCGARLPNKGFFLALLAAWLAIFAFYGNSTFGIIGSPSLYAWMHNAYNNTSGITDDGHGNLIPFVVLALMWWKRDKLLSQPLRAWTPGLLIVLAGVLLHIVGYLVQQPRISVIALFVGTYGLMGLAWGPGWLRACLFPYFLFAFSVPVGSLAESVTFPLRVIVTQMVALIGQLVLGIDVVADGTRLVNTISHYEYEVAAACSGIRSLVATTAIALIYAFMVFPAWWKRIVLIGSAIPLAVIGNTVRLLTIVLAAEMFGQKTGEAVHEHWFWSLLPYVPAIAGLLFIGRWLERTPDKPKLAAPAADAPVITS